MGTPLGLNQEAGPDRFWMAWPRINRGGWSHGTQTRRSKEADDPGDHRDPLAPPGHHVLHDRPVPPVPPALHNPAEDGPIWAISSGCRHSRWCPSPVCRPLFEWSALKNECNAENALVCFFEMLKDLCQIGDQNYKENVRTISLLEDKAQNTARSARYISRCRPGFHHQNHFNHKERY